LSHKLAVLGTGLIGGSIGLGARAARPAVVVAGHDLDADALAAAVESGAVTEGHVRPEDAVAGADFVVVSVPVDAMRATFRQVAAAVPPDAIVTDVGSAKRSLVEEGERLFGGRFVGGHPMAGSERHGIAAADPRLFDGAWWIVTPTEITSERAYSAVTSFVTKLGATPVAVDPPTHDALVARLSHVPQLTASALVEVAIAAGDREALLGLAAGGFRDVTRIAASNPDLWVGILRANRVAVLEALEGLRGRLGEVSSMVAEGRWEQLRVFLERARSARLGLFAKPDFDGAPVTLSLLVPDRPGLLAEVTTAAGRLGANIEDLRIVHSTEGGRGRLELVVTGEERADVLAGALEALGHRVERMPPGVEDYG
jgi:prephenate dehydrogenase